MFFFLLSWQHASYSQHPRFKKVPSGISHDAIAIEFFIFLLLSSFCPENSTLVKVLSKIGLIYRFLSITPSIMELEHITLSPYRIPFPLLGHIYTTFSIIRSLRLALIGATRSMRQGAARGRGARSRRSVARYGAGKAK